MKQFLNELLSKLFGKIGKVLLGIACLHEMGMSPMAREGDASHEEARFRAGIVRLKHGDEAVQAQDVQWG